MTTFYQFLVRLVETSCGAYCFAWAEMQIFQEQTQQITSALNNS